jgi:hypothetical protein
MAKYCFIESIYQRCFREIEDQIYFNKWSLSFVLFVEKLPAYCLTDFSKTKFQVLIPASLSVYISFIILLRDSIHMIQFLSPL